MMIKPIPDLYPTDYQRYINLVKEEDLIDALEQNLDQVTRFFHAIPDGDLGRIYAPGKWTIPAILLHVSDTERVMAYRAFWISRGGTAPLEGFDENEFMAHVRMENRYLPDILADFKSVRAATLSLFRGLDEEALSRQGTADGKPTTVIALGFFIPGHAIHHLRVISEKYLGKSFE